MRHDFETHEFDDSKQNIKHLTHYKTTHNSMIGGETTTDLMVINEMEDYTDDSHKRIPKQKLTRQDYRTT